MGLVGMRTFRIDYLINQTHIIIFFLHQAWTPKSKWVGGYLDKAGQPVKSKDVVKAFLSAHGFELVHEEDVPFMIREHVRKFQYGVSHASVWRKN